jgi:hypothetical protein
MNFVGYTYKADVEAEKSMLVNVLKELDSVSDQQFEQQNDSQQYQQMDEVENMVPQNEMYQGQMI